MKPILFLILAGLGIVPAFGQVSDRGKVTAGAERAFERYAKAAVAPGPGCAVGVSYEGHAVFEKAFGMAEIEHGTLNTPQTIFESGSVAKQFTAASIVMLFLEGKLGLDDPVRKYITELPDYGKPLTIRHLLNHTAGLRDWGTVLATGGEGRGARILTQAQVLDVITRQRELNFAPGSEYSYSNSNYTLLATIVERVSKQSLPVFTAERFFKPLGMTRTSWRDDYQRLVPGRAQAYSRQGAGPWRLEMPLMSVYGSGGMLTTVGDWLKWNAMLDSRSLGVPLVDELETTGVLNDGRKITYALGLVVTKYKGLREISHSGSTAGYQTNLSRYPDQKVSVAVQCNGTAPSPSAIADAIVDEIFGPFPAVVQPEAMDMGPTDLQKYAGLWREEKTHQPVRTVFENGTLKIGTVVLRPLKDGTFQSGTGAVRYTFKLDKNGKAISAERNTEGAITLLIAEQGWEPRAADLTPYAGDWYASDADASYTFAVEGDKAFLVHRPETRVALTPLYKDHFSFTGGRVVWFSRDAAGKVNRLHIGSARMRDMPFERVKR